MTLEMETTRGLAAQVLRHRSFTFQEFSQRYASTNLLSSDIELPELRRQDTKNRQNSIDDLDPEIVERLNVRWSLCLVLHLIFIIRCWIMVSQRSVPFCITSRNTDQDVYDWFDS